jgi:hypothetical protein
MQVDAVDPTADTGPLLAGAQFSDAFRVAVDGTALDARHAAEQMLSRQPRWITTLMALRDRLVMPFGLKTSADLVVKTFSDTIGIFPVLSQSPDRLVAGFDDRHLDFRVVIDVAASGPGQEITATTLVLTHNRLGRTYLAIILPFHRLVVRSMLRQVAA